MNILSLTTRRSCVTLPALAWAIAALWLAGPAWAWQEKAISSEHLLPSNTTGWVSVPDVESLKQAIKKTQIGEMMDDPNVKPFIDDLARQLRDYLNQQKIRFGMKLEDIEAVHSGEICLAGVLRKPAEGAEEGVVTDHAIVLLVDVTETLEQASALLEKVGQELVEREATEEKIEVAGVTASKWAFKKPQGLRQKQFAYYALVNNWLLATDNESAFRDVIERIVDEENSAAAILADNQAFTKVFEKCNFASEAYQPHVRWFVEPFGYVQLAQAIVDAQNSGIGKRNNVAEKFHEEGFSAIQGVGGVVSFHTGDHEAAHRTYIYAPPTVEGEERYSRAAAMLDFANAGGQPLSPPAWAPTASAGYLTFTWNLAKALNKVGYIIDKTTGTDGSFQRALESIKKDPKGPQVDIPELVSKLEDRISVVSVTQTPIDDESERIVFGVKIRDAADEAFVNEAIFRLVRSDAEIVEFEGLKILVVDTSEVAAANYDFEEGFDDEFGGDPFAEDEDEEAADELKPAKPLFEKYVVVVKNGVLLVGNHLGQVQTIVQQMPDEPGSELAQAADFRRVREALQGLAGDQPPSVLHFGRLDKTLHTNYEMLRTDRMPQSKTIMGQLLNRAYTTDDTPEDFVRKQEVDGSRMPEDFEGQVARYLGPSGLVIHTLDEGWLATGVFLKKEASALNTTTEAKEELAADNQ